MTVWQKEKTAISSDPLCLDKLLSQIHQGRNKCSSDTHMVELAGVEPASRNSPTYRHLQFSSYLIISR